MWIAGLMACGMWVRACVRACVCVRVRCVCVACERADLGACIRDDVRVRV